MNNHKILCATNEGELGVHNINQHIEDHLIKTGMLRKMNNSPFYENMPVIISRNMYDYGIFNGDIGLIRKDENGELKVYFDQEGEAKELPILSLTNYNKAFALKQYYTHKPS